MALFSPDITATEDEIPTQESYDPSAFVSSTTPLNNIFGTPSGLFANMGTPTPVASGAIPVGGLFANQGIFAPQSTLTPTVKSIEQTPASTGGSLSDVLKTDITYAPGASKADEAVVGGEYLGKTTGLPGTIDQVSIIGTGPIDPGDAARFQGKIPITPASQAGTMTGAVGSTGQTMSLEDAINKQINAELADMAKAGITASEPVYGDRLQAAATRGVEIYNAAVGPERRIDVSASGTPAAQGNKGFPIAIPIPGLDPATAAALSIAGIVFSGGNVARFDPSNPLGSLAGAVQGTGQTIANVGNVITGQTGISTPPTTGGGGGAAGAGAPSSGTGAGAQGAGEQSGDIGTTPIFGGGLGGGGGAAGTQVSQTTPQVPSAASISAAQAVQQQSQAAAVAAAAARQQAADAARKATETPSNLGQPSTVGSGAKGGDVSILDEPPARKVGPGLIDINRGGQTAVYPDTTAKSVAVDYLPEPPKTSTPVTPTSTPSGTTPTTSTVAPSTFIINPMATGYTLPTTGTPAQRNLYQEATTTTQALGSPMQQAVIGMDSQGKPIYGNVPLDPATGQPMSVSQGIASGYGGLARGMTAQDISNLLQSIGAQTGAPVTGGYQAALTRAANEQTAAANTALRAGNIADAESLFARAQALRTQANPQLYGETGALPQFTTAAQNQVARDVAALRQAEAGQLTQEQIRNAQQAAREAYGARGQVFSQGAAAQEVLNRANMIQQQQQLARQNLAQSMGQLGGAIGYQTANIFDPFATTLGQQYGMQTQNIGMNQALYNQAMGLTSGAGGYGFAQQMVNPFSNYAQDVYSMNVNAINDAMNAAANRQAALEAAKMGQTGEYAKALGTLITTGGLGRIQSGLSSGAQGILDLLSGKWPGSTTTATPIT